MFAQSQTTEAVIAQVVFLAAMAMIAFTYAGYPALMLLLSIILKRPVRRDDITPRVSIIIAAYNEERDIAAKLKNTLALDYPRERMEIIVASDCSTDRTDEIVRSFSAQGVILYRQPERFGKTVAQNRAVKASSGEILVFSDATTMYEPDAIRKIVRNFADPEVGCVAGQLIYADASSSAGTRAPAAPSWRRRSPAESPRQEESPCSAASCRLRRWRCSGSTSASSSRPRTTRRNTTASSSSTAKGGS